jgi:DNA-binding FadR family transcriptional regulator
VIVARFADILGSIHRSTYWRLPTHGDRISFDDIGRPPAEADLQRHFQVTPPWVRQMVLTVERAGLIRRRPGVARNIELLVEPDRLPQLRTSAEQIVKSSVQRY